jgi:hypothetical protein
MSQPAQAGAKRLGIGAELQKDVVTARQGISR